MYCVVSFELILIDLFHSKALCPIHVGPRWQIAPAVSTFQLINRPLG